MTVTLKLKPEVEAGLVAQAQVTGVSVEEYVLSVLERAILPSVKNALTPEERAASYEAWSAQHRSTHPLSDHAVSREAIYDGREH
jgi:hypothetical protein